MSDVRIRVLAGAFLLVFAVVGLRLVQVQILDSGRYTSMAESQSRRRELLSARRGAILGADGTVLAASPDGSGLRRFPRGPLAGQVVGCIGTDGAGLMGLEYHFDGELRGIPGWRFARRDARGRPYPGFEEPSIAPVQGLAVVTTLIPGLQTVAEAAVARAVERTGARSGAAVVVDARHGDILAMAGVPLFDPSQGVRSGTPRLPAIHLTYEPGSTFKMITAAAALDLGKARLDDRFDASAGFFRVGDQVIRDSHRNGILTFRDALAQSSNVCFAQIAGRVGSRELYRYTRAFGFGTPTGVALPGEEGGVLHALDRWSERTLYTMAMGQEVTATPLQVAMAYAAIANGGVLMRPRLVRAMVSPDGDTVRRVEPEPVRQVVSSATAELVAEALQAVVDSGTGALARVPGLRVVGKTGTSQKVDAVNGRYYSDRFVASFAGILLDRRAPLVCLVVLDEPIHPHTGGMTAAPVVAEIIRAAVEDPALPSGKFWVDRPQDLIQAIRSGGDTARAADRLFARLEEET